MAPHLRQSQCSGRKFHIFFFPGDHVDRCWNERSYVSLTNTTDKLAIVCLYGGHTFVGGTPVHIERLF